MTNTDKLAAHEAAAQEPGPGIDTLVSVRAALAEPAGDAVPDAWKVDGLFFRSLDSIPPAIRDGAIPLYTHPPAAPAAEPLTEAFDHSIGEGRYTIHKGAFWWHVRIGDSTANVGRFYTRLDAEDMALKLLTAYRDGAFAQFHGIGASGGEVQHG